ncbi:MAG: hypothetical protein ABJB04_01830, partial [Betaproteobacteria bacterium]
MSALIPRSKKSKAVLPGACFAALASATAGLRGTDAVAASSASFQLDGALDVAGGTSSSASFLLNSCVGSEIAGSSESASFKIDSGCGPALQFIAAIPGLPSPTNAEPIPTLSATASIIL